MPAAGPSLHSAKARSERAARLLEAFALIYPEAHCELDFSNPLELLVATILSAQCTDKRVNLVTKGLFAKCRTARDYAELPLPQLEELVKSTNFFRNKARNIQACCRELLEKHGGEVPRNMEALVSLAGVGRKTANVVLGNAFDLNEGIVVDTHVLRLSRRFGLTRQATPEKIELDLIKILPRSQWAIFSHWLIWHGRRRCYARNPDCAACEVAHLCPRLGVKTTRPALPPT